MPYDCRNLLTWSAISLPNFDPEKWGQLDSNSNDFLSKQSCVSDFVSDSA